MNKKQNVQNYKKGFRQGSLEGTPISRASAIPQKSAMMITGVQCLASLHVVSRVNCIQFNNGEKKAKMLKFQLNIASRKLQKLVLGKKNQSSTIKKISSHKATLICTNKLLQKFSATQ